MNVKKKGQVTIFVIVAIFIVVAGVGIYLFSFHSSNSTVPKEFSSVNTEFMNCLEQYTKSGISILESQGGYIDKPAFSPGSIYMPFSSQLDFAGVEIPYWSYVSGAGIPKTQVPTIEDMQTALENYLDNQIKNCYMDDLKSQGYSISFDVPQTKVSISDKYVDVSMKMDLHVSKGNVSATISNHDLRFNSFLGNLYNDALDIYNQEKKTSFLENYSFDVLTLYAPFTGVDLSCSPETWNAQTVYENVARSLEDNIMSLTNQKAGNISNYFILDLAKDAKLNFVYSQNWPTYFEVNPAQNKMMIAKPIGNQKGLGILGFCYVPYHFIYTLRNPVLIQLSKGKETFQFPSVMRIENNKIKKSPSINLTLPKQEPFCDNANTNFSVDVFNMKGEKVDANISYSCFGSSCNLGSTTEGHLNGIFPQCVNGILGVNAKGYDPSNTVYSIVNNGTISVYLNKEYNESIQLNFENKTYNGEGLVTFTSMDGTSQSIVLPMQRTIFLAAGTYSVQVYLYSNSSITLPATNQTSCATIPRGGLLGSFGLTQKVCKTNKIPSQIATNAIIGGGVANVTFDSNSLINSNTVLIKGDAIHIPKNATDLQKNFLIAEMNKLEVSLVEN